MATFNQPICLNSTTNTGKGSCSFERAPIKYVIAVPNAFTLTATTFGTLITTLQTKAVSPNRNDRIYFLGAFTNSEPQVTEPTFETTGNGSKILVRNEVVNMRLEMKGATTCDHKAIASFRGLQKTHKFLFYQSNGLLWGQGVINPVDPNLLEMGGAKAQLVDVPIQAGATYEAAPVSYLDINFLDMRALQGNEVWFDCNGLDIEDTFDTFRVTSVKLAKSAVVGTTGVFKFTAASSCGANLGIDFKDEIDGTAFTAINVTTGAGLAITSAVANGATGEITVTLTAPPVTGTKVRISLASTTILTGLGISYFESMNDDGTNYVEFTNI